MTLSSLSVCACLELAVVLFQIFGVFSLFLYWLTPTTRWGLNARRCFVVAMIGLGILGALCGQQDSEFALFAGGSMTVLLIGVTMGSGHPDGTPPAYRGALADPQPAA